MIDETLKERIYQLRIMGFTLDEVADILNNEGYTTVQGKPFYRQLVVSYVKRFNIPDNDGLKVKRMDWLLSSKVKN